MKKRCVPVLISLLFAFFIGIQIGKMTRPENFQLKGRLSFDPVQVPSAEYEVSNFVVKWNTEKGGYLTVESKGQPGLALWQTIPGEAFVMLARGAETVKENRGIFKFEDNWQALCTSQTMDKILYQPNPVQDSLLIYGTIECNNGERYSYTFDFRQLPRSQNQLVWGAGLIDSDNINRIFLVYKSSPEEHFFGFGEQFTNFDMNGKVVPIWPSEQGVGRGEQPITFLADITNGGAGGNEFTSYAPMPAYMTNQQKMIYFWTDNYIQFDFTEAGRVQVECHTPYLYGNLIYGETPRELLSERATYLGNMKLLPEWVYSGAIVGMQGGTEKVRQVYDELKKRNTPVAAFWLQDWVGQRTTSFGKQLWWNWEVDYDRYPGWEQLVSELNNGGVNMMVYVSPYLADIGGLKPNVRRNLFQEAKDKGYLVKNSADEPYLVLNTDFYFGIVDLTNPEARAWYKQVIKNQVVGSGAKGWMADFGEGIPYEARFANPSSGTHDVYIELWAELNREIVDETGKDLVFFNRAAYTDSPKYATLYWEGDQLVDWSAEDGIKSAVTGLNTSGLSGMVFNHSDIGGYTTITNPLISIHRSRELLYRWMEMNAFTLIFRTHEGNQPDKNVQFYTDSATLDTFAYWAKVYAALFDYRKMLVTEAAATGLPVVRHPFIQYPDDPETWKITYQEFMLGSDFLIAPVTDEGATEVTVYLPKGSWTHLWSGKVYQGGQYITVPAPIGQPGVFYLSNSKWGQDLSQALTAQGLMP